MIIYKNKRCKIISYLDNNNVLIRLNSHPNIIVHKDDLIKINSHPNIIVHKDDLTYLNNLNANNIHDHDDKIRKLFEDFFKKYECSDITLYYDYNKLIISIDIYMVHVKVDFFQYFRYQNYRNFIHEIVDKKIENYLCLILEQQ